MVGGMVWGIFHVAKYAVMYRLIHKQHQRLGRYDSKDVGELVRQVEKESLQLWGTHPKNLEMSLVSTIVRVTYSPFPLAR